MFIPQLLVRRLGVEPRGVRGFEHPKTFDTLAMDPAKKKEIMDDLDAFRGGKDYYTRVGKAWKRGYLLYGPPGSGKSTMIAAMANYLEYDVYDIKLTSVRTNTDLRRLFIETTSKKKKQAAAEGDGGGADGGAGAREGKGVASAMYQPQIAQSDEYSPLSSPLPKSISLSTLALLLRHHHGSKS